MIKYYEYNFASGHRKTDVVNGLGRGKGWSSEYALSNNAVEDIEQGVFPESDLDTAQKILKKETKEDWVYKEPSNSKPYYHHVGFTNKYGYPVVLSEEFISIYELYTKKDGTSFEEYRDENDLDEDDIIEKISDEILELYEDHDFLREMESLEEELDKLLGGETHYLSYWFENPKFEGKDTIKWWWLTDVELNLPVPFNGDSVKDYQEFRQEKIDEFNSDYDLDSMDEDDMSDYMDELSYITDKIDSDIKDVIKIYKEEMDFVKGTEDQFNELVIKSSSEI